MRIAFDATAILGPMSKNRGIGNYSLSQFATMIELDKENTYYFFNMFEPDYKLSNALEDASNLCELALSAGPEGLLLQNKEFEDVVGEIVEKYIRENEIDIFCITSPFDSFNVIYKQEWFSDCKVVAIVYDIIPYVMKNHYLADKVTYNLYMKCIDMLRWADEIQVISQSVKDDLVSYLKFDSEKISVIWGAVDKRYKKIVVPENEKKVILNKFKIKDQYVMCTGGDDERKNLAGLIEAYGKLPREIIDKYQLVIVCKLSAPAMERYTALAAKLKVTDRVILTNFVSDRELLVLYNLAKLMAFPSVYEGFGLPVVEAWACGTPVLTSNNSSLVQIAGDAAVIVDPKDLKDITKGLQYALTECDLTELLKRGEKRLQEFQWEKVALASIESFKKINGLQPQKEHVSKEKIAFFSPLPPLQSGISDYSVDILRALKCYCDIDVYIDKGYEPQVEFGDVIHIYSYKQFESHAHEYTDIIYQVGNSTFHLYMYEFIKKYPGIVVLHDYNMHGVLLHDSLGGGKNNFKQYRTYLLEDYPESQVSEYLDALQKGQCAYKMREWELNGIVTNYARKIIVHSFDAKEKLLQRDIARDVRQIWSFVNLEKVLSKDQRVELKEGNGYGKNEILVAAFGHIHETKRAIPILKAMGKLVKEYHNVKMVFVGKLADELKNEFYEVVNGEGLHESVKVTGYTSLQEFEEYISATDICLNLRYPYNGETSASLVRNLAKGNIVITNQIGSFAEIPDDICIKIKNVADMTQEEEVEAIYLAVKRCIDNPDECERIRDRAEKFASKHLDVKKAARDYYDFMKQPNSRTITEKTLNKLANCLSQKDAGMDDLLSISKTLAWLKEKCE